MSKIYGNKICPYITAKSKRLSVKKPKAKNFIKQGIKSTPRAEIIVKRASKIIKIIDAKLEASLGLFFKSTNIGMNTLLKDPSANIFLSMVGSVKATRNA